VVLVLLGALMQQLAPLIEYLAEGVQYVANAIAGAWNWMIGEIQSLFKSFEDLPFIGGFAKDVADGLESMKVPILTTTDALGGLTQAINDTVSAAQASAKAKDTSDAAAAHLAALQALKTSVAEGDGHEGYQLTSNDQALLDELGKEITQAQKDADMAALQAVLAHDQLRLADDKQLGAFGATDAAAAADAVSRDQQAILLAGAQANISAASAAQKTADNTRVIAEQLTNLPSFYRGLAGHEAAMLGSGTGGGGGGTTEVHIHIENLTPADPEDFMKKLEDHFRRAGYRQGGSLAPRLTGRNVTTPPRP
jgi:hypothetical protein